MNFSTTSTKTAGYDLGFRCIVILYSDPFWYFFLGDFLDILVASKLLMRISPRFAGIWQMCVVPVVSLVFVVGWSANIDEKSCSKIEDVF